MSAVQAEHGVPEQPLVWHLDPVAFALEEGSAKRLQGEDHESTRLCTEVGRRLLRMQYGFHEWVLRRVEKVTFDHDRRVSRQISIDLRVPDHAPVLRFDDHDYWLVPLTVMRRRTLVNLDIADEDGRHVSMLGLRFTQQLDEAMLRAAATSGTGSGALPDEVEEVIRQAVSGDWHTVEAAEQRVSEVASSIGGQPDGSSGDGTALGHFLGAPLFREALDRMWHNFSLHVLLPCGDGVRHRLLRMSFDEPVDWVHQRPNLKPTVPEHEECYEYRPYADRSARSKDVLALLGLTPTTIRFLTPSAENCASYHFEFTAPPGVRIARATLLAGRPNRAPDGGAPRITLDDVDGYGPTVGLHGVEIPNGSLARAQVELRLQAQGWLSTLAVACLAACAALLSVLHHTFFEQGGSAWNTEQANGVAVILFGVTAGAATFVAHHEATEVGRRMVSGLRLLGAIAIAAPAVGGAFLIYLGDRIDDQRYLDGKWWVELICFTVAVVCTAVVVAAWALARQEKDDRRRISPWDMTNVAAGRGIKPPVLGPRTYLELVHDYGFDKSVLGVYSAEGWHEVYRWDETSQREAMEILAAPGNLTRCRCGRASHS